MKRAFWSLLVVLGLGLTGCIQAVMETNLEADGSGSFLVSYSMSPSVAEAIEELQELEDSGSSDMPMFSDVDEDDLRKICKENGVTLKKFESSDTGMEIAGDFEDLAGLNAVMSTAMEGGSGGFGIFRTGDGNYVLKTVEGEEMEEEEEGTSEMGESGDGDTAQDMSETEAEDMEEGMEDMGKAMEIMGKLMGSISELDVVMRFTVPGDIIESNAPKTEGRTSIWEINGENVMSMDNSSEPEILFSGKGLKIDAPKLEP